MISYNILVVDDNPSIHIDFNKILCPTTLQGTRALEEMQSELFGKPIKKNEVTFNIDSAYQGKEALKLVLKGLSENRQYAIVFIDVRMPPGIDGVETARRIWDLDHEVQIVLCTAYSDYSWEDLQKRFGKTDRLLILRKPFENIEVLQLANTLSEKWNLNHQLQKHVMNMEREVNDKTIHLSNSLALLNATLEATHDGILVLDKEFNVTDCNQKFLNLLGLPASYAQQVNKEMLKDIIFTQVKSPNKLMDIIKNLYQHPELEMSDFVQFIDGKIIEYHIGTQYINNKIVGKVISVLDITEQKKLEQVLELQVTHDPLTKLANRILLYDRAEQAITLSKRNDTMVAVLFLNLDFFKHINEKFGHEAGDKVLTVTAKRLRNITREHDTVARIDGDEFVIIIPLLEKVAGLITLCEKILNKLSQPIRLNSHTVSLTVSIGISIYPKDGKDANLLIKNADAANHLAKETRNNFQFFTMELNQNVEKRLFLEGSLRLALERKQFILHYQPIFDALTNEIVATEALLRWQHPKLGLIPPLAFIPVAEDSGLMLRIGDWVLDTACAQNRAWQKQGLPPIRISINITSKQLTQPNFIEQISDVLNKTGMEPGYLELELIESTLIEGCDKTIRVLQELKNIGVKIAIDDFGTGYSSLSYLNQLPIDKIKIDRSFINSIGPNQTDIAVVLAIIAMAKSLNIIVLAEGVETKEQLAFLREHHCDEIQGFLFSRPRPAESLIKILQKKKITRYKKVKR